LRLAGATDASSDEAGIELQSDDDGDADQPQPERVRSADSEDESSKDKRSFKKQTAQKGRKHMTRMYNPDPPDNAAQPPRNRKQQQGDDFIKGLGETLSATAAANDRAALERHRETQRSLLYKTELKAYMALCLVVGTHFSCWFDACGKCVYSTWVLFFFFFFGLQGRCPLHAGCKAARKGASAACTRPRGKVCAYHQSQSLFKSHGTSKQKVPS